MNRLIFAIALLVGACGDNPPANYPTTLQIDESKFPLGPQDKIDLVVYYGSKDIKATYVIDSAGDIEVQYIGRVPVSGKTAHEIQNEVQQRLADGYLVEPIVQITVAEINSQKLSVFGQVARSGSVKFVPGMTIVDAIANSGGFSPMARKNMVKVTRTLDGKTEIYKIPVEMIAEGARPQFPVMPGDQVFVPERPW